MSITVVTITELACPVYHCSRCASNYRQCLNSEKRSVGMLEARRENRGAEGEGNGKGCPPPQPTRGSGGAS